MINQEIAENPVLEESAEAGDEMTPEEVQALLERERLGDPADQSLLQSMSESTNGIGRRAIPMRSPDSRSRRWPTALRLAVKLPNGRRTPIRSMRSISARSLTTISIPAIKPRPANRLKSRPLKRSFRRRSRWPIICSRSSRWKSCRKTCAMPRCRSSAIWTTTAICRSRRRDRAERRPHALKMSARRCSSCSRSIPPALAPATCASAC